MNAIKTVYDKAEGWLYAKLEHWSPAAVPDLRGKVALVTGGNSGIGFETARKLADAGARVLLVSRMRENGDKAAACIREEVGKYANVEVLECDFSRLANVANLIREVKATTTKLDILVLTAGVFLPGPYMQTVDGIEQTLAINFYAHALLTMGLLGLLRATRGARVVHMSSSAETFGKLDWNNLKGDKYTDSGMQVYGTSKVYGMMFSRELSVRVPEVDFLSVEPGLVLTPMQKKVSFMYPWAVVASAGSKLVGQTQRRGAYSTIYAATEPSLTGTHTGYYGPNSLFLYPTSERQPAAKPVLVPVSCWKLFEETIKTLKTLVPKVNLQVPKHPDEVYSTSNSAHESTPSRQPGNLATTKAAMPVARVPASSALGAA